MILCSLGLSPSLGAENNLESHKPPKVGATNAHPCTPGSTLPVLYSVKSKLNNKLTSTFKICEILIQLSD